MRLDLEFFVAQSGGLGTAPELSWVCSCFPISGDFSRGETPVPIPNTEVKPSSADDTAWETVWESRSSPGFLKGVRGGRIKGQAPSSPSPNSLLFFC